MAWSQHLILGFLIVLLSVGIGTRNLLDWAEHETLLADRYRSQQDLGEIVAHFSRIANPVTFYQEAADRVVRSFFWEGNPGEIAKSIVRPGVRLFFFDGSGKRTFPVGSFPDMKTASERSLALLRRFAKSPKGVLDTSEEALASSFFGSPEVVSFLSGNPGRVLELVSTGLNRLQGFFPIRVKGGKRAFLFLDVDLSRVDRFELVRVAKERVKRLAGPAFDLGFVDNSGKFSTKTTCGSKVPLNLARKLKAVRVSTDFFYKGRFYSTANLSERIQVFGSRRLPSRYSRFGFWRGVLSTAMFAGIFLMLLLGRADEAEPFSVRARVLLMFGLAAGLSTLTLLGFAGIYLEIRQDAIIRKTSKESGEVLRKVDGSFQAYLKDLENQFKRLVSESNVSKDPIGNLLRRMPVIFSGREGWLSGFVVGTSGELLFRGEPKAGRVLKGLWGNKRGVVASRLGKRAIRAFNMASEASLTPKKLQTKDPMVDLEGAVLRQFMGSRGTVGRYYWGKEEFKIFFDLVVDPSGKACGSILLFQESQILQGAFVKMVERRYRRFAQRNGEPPFRLLAFPKMGRIAFSEPLRRNGLAAEILRMQDSLNKMGNLNSRIVSLFGVSGKSRAESLSITGLPGAELETLNLYFFLGMGAIETASRALLSRLACFAAFVIGFALLLGSIFSVTLLKPFGILVKGLKSLVAGRYAETISIESGDEFQGIGDGLNHILGEMKDLALAQTIHDRLFPASAFRSADSACHGWILESTGTEGHFFDHIETGAGQLAFWVGRLPEQGVSDALLIGSLKMAIRVSLGLGEKDVSRISEEVHRKFLTPSSRSSFDSAFSSPSSPASCSAPNFAIDYASGFAPASETAFESRSKSAFEVASENFGLFLGILDRKTGRLDFSLRGDLTVWNADAPNIKHDGSFQTILLKSGERFAVTTFGKNVIQGFDAQTFQERFEKLLRAESGVVLEHFGNETARLLRNFPIQGKVRASHVILVADFRGRGL